MTALLHSFVSLTVSGLLQVDALDDLLQRERSALQEVLQAARKRVADIERDRDEMHAHLAEEIQKVLSLEQRISRMKEEHNKQACHPAPVTPFLQSSNLELRRTQK